MTSLVRKHIFARLDAARRPSPLPSLNTESLPFIKLDQEERVKKLKTLMEAMRTEVHVVNRPEWIVSLIEVLKNKGFKELLYAPGTDIGIALEKLWKNNMGNLPELIPYNQNIEPFKSRLFDVEASITSTAGAIADIGAIALWPDEKEPRSMSLVPSVHFAILDAEHIHNSLSEIIQSERWAEKMPTNAVLISGPSKTADIELELAYGVHGPKELVLFIVKD